MKNTALFFIAFTVSTSLFACWGERTGFWDDAVRTATPILSKIQQSPKQQEQLKISYSAISGSYWNTALEFLRISYLTKLLPK